jgi:hypothetical protein
MEMTFHTLQGHYPTLAPVGFSLAHPKQKYGACSASHSEVCPPATRHLAERFGFIGNYFHHRIHTRSFSRLVETKKIHPISRF